MWVPTRKSPVVHIPSQFIRNNLSLYKGIFPFISAPEATNLKKCTDLIIIIIIDLLIAQIKLNNAAIRIYMFYNKINS